MLRKVAFAASIAALLSACSPALRPMPNVKDAASLSAAIRTLSPWKDGGPDRSNDGRTPAETGSDRSYFIEWLQRYDENETYNQHERDYKPMVVPWTIGQAINDQRHFDQVEMAERAKADAEQQRQTAVENAKREQAISAEIAAQQAQERATNQRDAAEEAEYQREVRAGEAATAALTGGAHAASVTGPEVQRQQAKRDADQQADLACRQRREQAKYQASLNRNDPQAAIARVQSTFGCPSDRQLDAD